MKLRSLWAALVLALIAMVSFAFMPAVFLPKRWLDIKPRQERSAVHAVLGVPDANYSEKGFDGWHNPFGFGASVLIVRYDESLSRVVSTDVETKWGTEHRDWVQEYKQRSSNQATPVLR